METWSASQIIKRVCVWLKSRHKIEAYRVGVMVPGVCGRTQYPPLLAVPPLFLPGHLFSGSAP